MTKNYQTNDYSAFLEQSDEPQNLAGLLDHLIGVGLEGTPWEGQIIDAVVNSQYELIVSGSNVIVYDKMNNSRVVVTERAKSTFLDIVDKELQRQCGGIPYADWEEDQCMHDRFLRAVREDR